MVRVQTSGSSGDLRRVSPPSSPVSISGSSGGRKLNLIAFAGTLVYIGYLIGSIDTNEGGGVKLWGSTGRELDIDLDSPTVYSNDVSKLDSKSSTQLRQRKQLTSVNVTKDRMTDLAVTQYLVEKIAAAEDDSKAITKQYTVGPVINKDKGQVTTINLIGERHSGTNWITDHLVDCFGGQIDVQTNFTRFKHWFQFDDATVRNEAAVVIAMFRDPYDWIEAMRERPHHAHEHIGMEWKDFVTKPWVGPRGPKDHAKIEEAKKGDRHIDKWGCLAGYKFDEVIPCSAEDSVKDDGYSNYMYELKNDESHRAYGSIVELRSEKIRNFVKVPTFHGVKAFFPKRYEELSMGGTASLLKELEEVSGLTAKCKPFPGSGKVKHKVVDPEYTEWMNRYHDWEAEAMIGYEKRDPIPREEVGELSWEQEVLRNSTRQSQAQIK